MFGSLLCFFGHKKDEVSQQWYRVSWMPVKAVQDGLYSYTEAKWCSRCRKMIDFREAFTMHPQHGSANNRISRG